MFKNLSITIKVLIFTLLIGALIWFILDYVQSKAIQQIIFTELASDLEVQAKEDRMVFDRYLQSHNQAAKLIISQQRFQTYVVNNEWRDNEDIKHHYRLPLWLPKASVMRTFFSARFAILIDSDKQVREVYHYFPDELPQILQETGTLLQKLSHNQSYMTTIDGLPYVISSRNFRGETRQVIATLMLASPVNDDFLMSAVGDSKKGVVVTLIDGEPDRVIASSNPDLLPSNTLVADLEETCIKTGASFFDYGASDVNAQFASFMKKERAYHLANHILNKSKKQRAFFAAMLILSFVLLLIGITQRIRRVTQQIVVFSKDSQGLEIRYSGDEIAKIVTSFQQLRGCIKRTIELATAIAAGNYKSSEIKNYSERSKLGRALFDMNNTLQSQAQELQRQQEELRQANKALSILNNELEQRVARRTEQLAQANQKITALNERLKVENLRLGAELDVARQLQKMVLPSDTELKNIAGLDIAGFMEPADEVGGDYYDVLQHNGNVKIGIGDVTGHGLESGVLMLMVQVAVRTLLASKINNPETFLSILNRVIYDNVQRMKSDKNLTLSLLDYSKGTLYLSGQHEEVLVVRKGGKIERIDTIDLGFMVGIEPDISQFIAQKAIQLVPGDGLVLYTDGVTEARNLKKKLYGVERLCEVVRHHWQQPASHIQKAIIADVRQYIGTQKVYDDITLLVLKQK